MFCAIKTVDPTRRGWCARFKSELLFNFSAKTQTANRNRFDHDCILSGAATDYLHITATTLPSVSLTKR